MQPNITVMLAFKKKEIHISSIKFNNNILAWAANENSKKRFVSSTNLWTLQSTISWARNNINVYKGNKRILNSLVSTFLKLTGFNKDKLIYKTIHGWKYSYNLKKSPFKSYWDNKIRLGVCADWLVGPKVEDAWISANDLYKKQKKTPL